MAKASYGSRKVKRSGKRKSVAWYNKKYSAKDVAKLALKKATYLTKLINVETKFADTSGTQLVTTTAATVLTPSSIAQGDTTATRDGASLKVKSMQLRYTIDNTQSTDRDNLFRVIVYTQDQVNQSPMNPTDILQVGTNLRSPYNMNKAGYTILEDKIVNLSGTTGGTGGPLKYYGTFVWKPENFHVKYNTTDTAGTVTNLERGLIRVAIFQDTIASTGATFSFYNRVRFIDN